MSLQTSAARIRRVAVVNSLTGDETSQAPSVAAVSAALAAIPGGGAATLDELNDVVITSPVPVIPPRELSIATLSPALMNWQLRSN